MIIEINDALTIGELSRAFSESFPYLRIGFFTSAHVWGAGSAWEQRIEEDKMIGGLASVKQYGLLEIHAWQQTGAVEQAFNQAFGLHVQVFRREGGGWVQTTGTDGRTLEEQSKAAGNASQEWMDGTDERFNSENPY